MSVVADGSPLKDSRRTAGIGRYVSSLIRSLDDIDGLSLTVATPRRSPRRETWIWRCVNGQPALEAALIRRRPDLVHAMASDPTLLWPLRRQVVTVHDVAPWTTHLPPPRTPTWRYLTFQRARFARCGAVIAVSDSVASDVADLLDVQPGRIHVVPLGVDAVFHARATTRDPEIRRRAGVPEESYVLWVGSLRAPDPRKALDVLLDAMSLLEDQTRPLVLVGATGEEDKRLARRAEELGVRLSTPGYVTDETLAALYRGAAAVTLPSRHEGFGLPALEALACGAPLVVARVGNLPNLVDGAAHVVPPDDARALAAGLATVLSGPEVRKRAKAVGPSIATAYTWRRTAERTAEVYERALYSGPPPA